MNLPEVRHLATTLMREHGLERWSFRFDRAKTRAGQCRYDRREISLSAPLMRALEEAEVRETILHEIAHALAGPAAGHGSRWRAVAQRIGAAGEVRLLSPRTPKGEWVGTCPRGHQAHRHRRPSQPLSCAQCAPRFTIESLLTWTYRGRVAPMTPGYRDKERAIRARAALRTSA